MQGAIFDVARDLIIRNGRQARRVAEGHAAAANEDGEEDVAEMWRQIADEIRRVVPSL